MTRKVTTRKSPEERRAEAEALQATIAEQVQALRESETWERFLRFAQSFHRYSLGNLLLIFAQCPQTTHVAGYRTWQNHATTLVSRIFGDEHAYLAAARHWLDESGLPDVQIADASGMSPENRASARDLLEIGRLAAEQPVIAELTAQPSTLSTRGDLLTNTNDLLGTLDISGLKTGYTRAAGHTVLFTAPAGDHEQLIGVLLGSPSTAQRATDVTRLIAQVRALVAG